MKSNILKSIVNPKAEIKEDSEAIIIQYFNLVSQLFILIGLLTPYWYVFLSSFILIYIGNRIQSNFKIDPKEINKTIRKSKIVNYTVIIIKILTMLGASMLYFHFIK